MSDKPQREAGTDAVAAKQASGNRAVIDLQGISKQFILHKQKPFLVREFFHRLVGREAEREEFWALQGIDLRIRKGESLGLVGPNGAGKTTLLSIVAGTLRPTSGTVKVDGKVGALLALGAGFHEDLTGRENVYVNASLLGLTRDEVEGRFEQVVAFSGLEHFIDVPLRNYSSGMKMRLGYSVAIHVDPDILIMDEIIAVADAEFSQRCLDRLHSFKEQGKTLLVATHSKMLVEELCERVVWLKNGQIQAEGPTM